MSHPRPAVLLLVSTVIACSGGESDKGSTDDTGTVPLSLEESLACPGGEPMVIEDVEQLASVLGAIVPLAAANTLDAKLLQLARELDGALSDAGEEDCVDLVEDTTAGTVDLFADCVEVLDGVTLTGGFSATVTEDGYESLWTGLFASNATVLLDGDGTLSYHQLDVGVFEASADRSWTSRVGIADLDGIYTLSSSGTTNTPGEIYSGYLQASEAPVVPPGEVCFASTGLAEGEGPTGATMRELVSGSQLWEITYGADGCWIVTADGAAVEDTCS